jgi:23S rRNA pseudouridine1911/1915/1917 synthase
MNEPTASDGSSSALRFQVEESEAGQRLDAFLADHCPDLSRNRIQGDLEDGRVQVDGRSRPKGFKLRAGSRIDYLPGELKELTATPQDIPLDIIHQDEDILILNKPAGMVVHPAIGHPDGTVVNALLHHCQGLEAGQDPLRPGIVHRLDRDTTGLLAVALNDRAHRHLSDQLRDRRMGRTYLALSWGSWNESEGALSGDIGRNPRQRQKMAVVHQGGRVAVTHYEVLEDHGFVQLCRVKLETGRTHQIRVHFAQNSHPVVGDPLYGDDSRAKSVHPLDRVLAARVVRLADRQMLHACRLELEHPATGKIMTFEVPVPADMTAVLDLLNKRDEPKPEQAN